MKILHTSDLHIGKKLFGRERYGEYRAVFSELKSICEKECVELVLIAGDVFDTYTPSAEAEEIFYSGIKLLSEDCAVLVISGNHDDYVRLTAAATLAEERNIYILGNNLSPVNCAVRGNTYPVKSGSGWVIFQNTKGENVYINALPYPNEARFKEGKSDETFDEKMSRWIKCGEEGKSGDMPSVFLSHIFVAGGLVSDSEREIDLGGARVVPLKLLPECDYIALGHLHKRQTLGENAHYCGAPMQFSFDECGVEKSVNVFDLTLNGVKNLKQVPITSARKLIRLQANGVADGISLLKNNLEYFVELTLNLNEPVTPQEVSALHENENLVLLKAEIMRTETNDTNIISNKNKSASQLFKDYYKLKFGADAPNELLSLFLSLTEEE
ncbi:MAG: exonuclease subunit SbcD [Clostridia bacterium]|nr:exonuclease subunit SbcD [Clostridia bacterium]